MDIPDVLSRNQLTVAKKTKNKTKQTVSSKQQVLRNRQNLFQMTVEKVVTSTNYNRAANSTMKQSEFVAITSN